MTTTDGGAYIDKLAVRRDERGKGLARALLAESLRHVRPTATTPSSLRLDSRAGALGLYEHLGMVVTSRWINLAATTDS
ncbi:MAG: GNAT family N-acetyltransferase [Actinomycetales bacterium]|nr:GNAT family N-acetyltransferase [Actinomycetales bacterium]